MLTIVVRDIEPHDVGVTADVRVERCLLCTHRSIAEIPRPGDNIPVGVVRLIYELKRIEALQDALTCRRAHAEVDAWKRIYDHAYVLHYM